MRATTLIAVLAGLLVLGVVGAAGVARPPAQAPPPPTETTPPEDAVPPPAVTTGPELLPPVQPEPAPEPQPEPAGPAAPRRGPSRAIGLPWRGRLVNGVQLPEVGPDWLTWDPVLKRIPDRPWRRWGTPALLQTIERVLAGFRLAHPEAPPILIGDLSRPHGGVFDQRYGGLGHASHQNGLDADVYYPRADGLLRAASRPSQIDRRLSQDLVDGFVAEGAQVVFVGPRTGLRGPRKVVETLAQHDDHLHVRIFRTSAARYAARRSRS